MNYVVLLLILLLTSQSVFAYDFDNLQQGSGKQNKVTMDGDKGKSQSSVQTNVNKSNQAYDVYNTPAPSASSGAGGGGAMCDHLVDMCKSNCKHKEDASTFIPFAGTDFKAKCEEDCGISYRVACKQGKQYWMKDSLCSAQCRGAKDEIQCQNECKK